MKRKEREPDIENRKVMSDDILEKNGWKDRYKRAYEYIKPDEDSIDRIFEAEKGKTKKKKRLFVFRPVFITIFALCLTMCFAVPGMAKNIPAVYEVIDEYVPSLADYILPNVESCTRNGIIMQVEAVKVAEDTASVIVSFQDAEGSQKINGKVDMYDSVRLCSYDTKAESVIAGCSFLKYDTIEDKAYFKVDITCSQKIQGEKLTFTVRQLLTRFVNETKKIELDEMVKNPDLKSVVPNLTAGILDRSAFPGCFGEKDERYGRQKCNVLNLTETSEALADDLTIIGVAYLDGILRIQVCEGDCTMADRHLNVYLLDEDGNKKLEDYAVGWKEEVNGVELKFTEVWFLVEEEELEHYQMYGTSNISDGLVEGDWAVTFRLEEG